MLGGLVANITFGLLKVAVLFATVRAAGGNLHGYDTASMSSPSRLASSALVGLVGLTWFPKLVGIRREIRRKTPYGAAETRVCLCRQSRFHP